MLKDLMKAILNEDVEVEEDEIEEEQEKRIEPQTVSQPEPQSQPMPKETYVEPISAYPEPEIETFTRPKVQPKKEPKTSIFTGLDVEEVSRVEPRSTNKPYKYDRRKMMKLRTSEDLDYKPIILKAYELLNENGVIFIEYDKQKNIDIQSILDELNTDIKLVKSKKYGRCLLDVLR